jgi:hypothetical protein
MDNLTKDVIMAKKLGYRSYGMYKADHPRTKEHYAETERAGMKYCPICMETFYPHRKGVIYCSRKCKETAAYRKKKNRKSS